MRIASPPILVHILLCHLLLISPSLSASYQRSSNCQQQQQSRSQDQSGELSMGMRHGNSKQTASNIALKAAQEAKKASDTQAPAALAAARQVKHQLADKAVAAAKAAEAALAGKQQILEQLQDEVHEAEIIVQEESYSLVGSQVRLLDQNVKIYIFYHLNLNLNTWVKMYPSFIKIQKHYLILIANYKL